MRFFYFILLISLPAVAGLESACSFNKGNCPVDHGFVQDYGYGGFTAAAMAGLKMAVTPVSAAADIVSGRGPKNPECVLNPMTPVTTGAATLVNGDANDPMMAELEAIQCAGEAGKGYSFSTELSNIVSVNNNLDQLQEELVFLTATGDIHDFNECQNGLFQSYNTNPAIKRDLHKNAWKQFDEIRRNTDIVSHLREESGKRSDIVRANTVAGCTKEPCPKVTEEDFKRLREKDSNIARVTKLRSGINLLLSRIPMANRDSMRSRMEQLLLQPDEVTEASFNQAFENEMKAINSEIQKSRDFIRSITVMNGEKRLFCVDRDLKENLYRSGQIDHTIERLGLNDSLSQFKLRSQNRYGLAGTVVTEVAMIPTYFVGYGAARLALRAGASTVKAVSMTGRALAPATRLAMLGLGAADYSAAMAHALKDCDSDEFQARVSGEACDPNQEIGLAYEEASLAQCLTSAVLPFASAFVGTGVRVVSSPRLQKLYASVPSAVEAPTEIVVTAKRVKPRRPARSGPRPERSRDLAEGETWKILAPFKTLKNRITRFGSKKGSIPSVAPIKKAEEIPFDQSDSFRPIKADQMVQRAKDLDPEISGAITSAYNALNDPVALRKYYRELFTDAALWMKHKGRAEDLELLKKGRVSEHAIAVVLVRRAKDRGETDFTTILRSENGKGESFVKGALPSETELTKKGNDAFRFAVKSGPFFDKNFDGSSKYGHGVLTHMIQREIVTPHVSKATNGDPQKFWDFLGSKKGINFWADLFDSGNDKSMTRPETITQFLFENMFNP